MQQSQAQREAFDQVCGQSGGGAGVLKGLGIYSLLLLSLMAAVIF